MTKYEIHFFASDLRKLSNAHTYQVEATNMIEALNKWARDWPNGCAYYAKEGWDITGHGVVYHDPNVPDPEVKEVVELSPKERRALMRHTKG